MVILFAIANMLRGMDKWSPLGKIACGVLPAVALYQLEFHNAYELVIVSALSLLGCLVGHGTFYRLNHKMPPARPDNWPALLPRLLRLKRDTWLFNALALSVTGMCWTAPAATYLCVYNAYTEASIVLLAGALKSISYEIGWQLNGKDGDPITYCEMYFGAVFGASFYVIGML